MFLRSVILLVLWNFYYIFGNQDNLESNLRHNFNLTSRDRLKRTLYTPYQTGIAVSIDLSFEEISLRITKYVVFVNFSYQYYYLFVCEDGTCTRCAR